MSEVSASFAVDVDHLHALGVVDPYSNASLQIYKSGKLNSNERLYFSLWGSKLLSTVSFEAKKKIIAEGVELSVAYFIVSGDLIAIKGERLERYGPGSVIGLAEGLAGLPYPKTIVSITPVQARIIPLTRVDHIIPKLPQALRDILQTTIKRTLGVAASKKGKP